VSRVPFSRNSLDPHAKTMMRFRSKWTVVNHFKLAVTVLAVTPDLEVAGHRVDQIDAGAPLLAVEQLELHLCPGWTTCGIRALVDAAHRRTQAP